MSNLGDPYLMLKGVAIPVHKALSSTEPLKENRRVESDCHSIVIRNVGMSKMYVDGQPFEKGEFYVFTPPVLNVIDTTLYDVKFDGGVGEAWITRSIINFCFQ